MDQRADEPGCGRVEPVDQVLTTRGAIDIFIDAQKDTFDLLIQLCPVGDDQDAGVLYVLAHPFGQPDHGEALAAALGVPDDAALAFSHPPLGGFHAEILVVAADLLDAGVEGDEVVNEFQQTLFRA